MPGEEFDPFESGEEESEDAIRAVLFRSVEGTYKSIVTCFSQYKNIGELGRIGIKTMGMYLMTTMIAIILGISLFSIFKPGSWAFALSGDVAVSGISVDTGGAAPSLLDTIVNIVPSNFLKPFVDSNTLQLIFLAVVSGIAVGKIGDFSAVLRELLEALYSMFMTITNMFIRLMPLAVFASMTKMIVDMAPGTIRVLFLSLC